MPDIGPVTFPADGSVLDGVHFTVGDEEHVALFGPNGAGKSTLLRGAAGTLAGRRRAPGVAYLPQQVHLFKGTGRTNLALGGTDLPVAVELSERLGVGGVLDDDVRTMSVGQRQRLAIARVLASDEPVVLLDEPLAPIDTTDRRDVIAAIRSRSHGRALVTVTHSVTDAAVLADTLVILDRGRIVQHGPVAHVLSPPESVRVADIIGVTNVLEGTVIGHEGGLTTVDVDGTRLLVPGELPPGERALVRVGAESIVMYGSPPSGGSHRTVVAGRVAGIEAVGSLIEVHMHDPVRLTALVTEGSLEASELSEGRPVWFGIKAAAISVIWSG